MANKRKLAKKAKLQKNKDRLVVHYTADNDVESSASDSFSGESSHCGDYEIIQEENGEGGSEPPVPWKEPQCVSTLYLLHWTITLLI